MWLPEKFDHLPIFQSITEGTFWPCFGVETYFLRSVYSLLNEVVLVILLIVKPHLYVLELCYNIFENVLKLISECLYR